MEIFKRQLLANNGSMFSVSGISQLTKYKISLSCPRRCWQSVFVPLHKYVFTHVLIKIRICSLILFAEQFSGPSVCKTVLHVSQITRNLKCLARLRIVAHKLYCCITEWCLMDCRVITNINVGYKTIRLVRTSLFSSHIKIYCILRTN